MFKTMVTYISPDSKTNPFDSIIDYRFVKTLPAFRARFMGKHNDHGFKRGALYTIRVFNMAIQRNNVAILGINFGDSPLPIIRVYSLGKAKTAQVAHMDFPHIKDFINEWRIYYE